MKIVKILLGLGVALVMLVVVAGVLGIRYIDSLAKTGIEKGGTYALGVPTTLDSASIGLFSGKFALNGLNIDNPAGFKSSKFLSLGESKLDMALASLSKDTIEVPSFELSTVRLSIERRDGRTNYTTILDNLARLSSGEKPKQQPAGSKPAKKFAVRVVHINDVKVHVDMLGLPGGVSELDFPVDHIGMTNVGNADGTGVDIETLAGAIIKALIAAVVDKGQGILPADLLGELGGYLARLDKLGDFGLDIAGKNLGNVSKAIEKGLGQVSGELNKAADQVTKQADDAAKKAGDEAQKAIDKAGKEISKGLGNLLPGKKDEKKQPQPPPK